MTWAKIDDQFHAHPKVMHAWHADPASIGLHMMALSHCANHLTDGFVAESWVRSKLPTPARRRKALRALTDAGMWEERPGGHQIHDYLAFNESREEVQRRRAMLAAKRSDAGRRGARNRWQSDGKPDGKAMANGMANAWQSDGKPMAPSPYPFPTT